VLFLTSGQRLPEYRIEGSNVADLDVPASPITVQSGRTSSFPLDHTHHVPANESYKATQAPPVPERLGPLLSKLPPRPLADPAILSFGKPPGLVHTTGSSWRSPHQPPPSQASFSEVLGSDTIHVPPTFPSEGALPEPKAVPSITGSGRERTDSVTTASLTAPCDSMKLNGDANQLDEVGNITSKTDLVDIERVPIGRRMAQPLETAVKYTGKRSRRGGRGKAQREAAMQMEPVSVEGSADIDTSAAVIRKNQQDIRSKGWRQTSLIEETTVVAGGTSGLTVGMGGRQAVSSSKRKTQRQQLANGEDQNGWATEDATDIQDMGEFDFEGNLSKFDKRTVFDQIRNEDTTADEERLVSFNRRPARPGTAGGKNLHHTENVLDLSRTSGLDRRNNDSEESEDDDLDETRISSGRSSRRTLSRASGRHVSRKGSVIASAQTRTTAANTLLSSLNRGQYSPSRDTGSPRPSRQTISTSPITGPPASSKPSLRTLPNNKLCHCVSPLQMLEVEGVAISKLGLTDEMMTENAARAIAEITLSAITTVGKRPHKEHHHSFPVIVILAGNHKSGARAIAGGRQLCNHGVRVVICMVGYEQEEELLEGVRRQLDIFQKSGGRLVRCDELSSTLKVLDAPVELVIDALLGMHAAIDDLRPDDQVVTYELIAWANRLKTTVLAVDIPTGLDASTGKLDNAPYPSLPRHADLMGQQAKSPSSTAILSSSKLAPSSQWALPKPAS